jgi:hypothetical protein
MPDADQLGLFAAMAPDARREALRLARVVRAPAGLDLLSKGARYQVEVHQSGWVANAPPAARGNSTPSWWVSMSKAFPAPWKRPP